MLHKLAAASVAVLLAGLIPFSATAQQAPPHEVIEDFHDTLILAMREADTLGFKGRRTLLAPAVEETFNLALMTKIIVGTLWGGMSKTQRQHLIDAFTAMTISTYANRFDGYSGQTFELVDVTETRHDGRLVRTNLVDDDGERIAIDYLLLRGNRDWRVVDIYLKRISELATRSSDYTSVILREGVDSLITSIRAKTRELELERERNGE